MRNFSLTTSFPGYNNKVDSSKLIPGVLVSGSHDVYSVDGLRVLSRPGFTRVGIANTALYPILSSYDWTTSGGVERNVRCYNDRIEVLYEGVWMPIITGLTGVSFNFAEWYNITEIEDELLMANGSPNLYAWNGAMAEIASVTDNSLTKTGTENWSESRFYIDAGSQKKVLIDGVEYTYTGGETTTTLTGVTPSPVTGGITAGDIAIQKVVTNANLILATYNIDLIEVLNNQLWLADSKKRSVYISKFNDYTNYSKDSPRLVGQGEVLTLDACPKGFIVQEEYMWISAGTNLWYQSDLTISADNTAELVTVKRLKTAPQQGALSQSAIGKMKNNTVFISHEPTLDFLGNVENIATTQSTVISDPIKKDFDTYDFSTNVNLKYYKNNLYVAIPNESKLLIYNLDGKYWEAPWNVPAGRLAIIDGDLCIHSNAVPETYKLFDSYSDNGNPINAVAKFAYNLYDNPSQVKNFTEWLTVGYITGSTDLNLKLDYEYRGFGGSVTKQILGDDTDIILSSLTNANLGKENLGKEKLGGSSDIEDINKFRAIRTFVPSDFYEIQPEYSSYGEDQRWELLLFGGDITLTNYDNTSIKD